MKLVSLLILLGTAVCTGLRQDGFVLRGSVPGALDSTVVKLISTVDENEQISGYIIGGKFELRGKCPVPVCYKLNMDDGYIAKKKGKKFHCQEICFFLENGELDFSTPHIDSLPMPPIFVGFDERKEKNYTVTGSPLQDRFYRFQARTAPLKYTVHRCAEKFRINQDIEVARELQKAKEEVVRIAWETAEQERDMYLRLYMVEFLKKDKFMYDQAYLDRMARLFKENQEEYTLLAEFRSYLERAKAFVQNTPLLVTDLETPDGSRVSLQAHLNKEGYTLLDFWASWCGPCRASFPHLKKIHERSRGKLKIISISRDREKKAWLQALEEENLPWMQLYSTQELTSSLDITFIPSYFLVDAEGKVVFFGGPRGELDLKLEELGL